MPDIRESIDGAVAYLSEHPDEAGYTDSVATAVLEGGLRFRVTGPQGEELTTDMPSAVGGGAAGLSPGWLLRAALASCAGSLVAMEAARTGITLTALSVDVDSESDDRGILGMDPDVPAGPLSVRIRVGASVDGAGGAEAEAAIRRAIELCPVADAVRRAVDQTVEVV
ncbi:MAG: OsmC family protein [Actinomycetota bacterium]